ncbi:hypothetical protein E6W39_32795 [Kitasatospora acidiphila]|uniref:Uncharacterized protein n=1 Tax=Kitasatospora acidiphila TaxID=2567942 RepID=A0A540WB37_9ACTN|nr:hypothetical protein [Kitasatospora acidiphila]TQF06127.1 hypothetical protein E6W39_32795 [Kitasatospora acidiphila]
MIDVDVNRTPGWLKARYSLALVVAAWACTVPTLLADDDIGALLRKCQNSPGAPGYVLPLAWAGLVLGIGAVGWGGWQLVAVMRAKSRQFSGGHALLYAVLPVAAIAALLQTAVLQTAIKDSHPRPSPCFGSARLATDWTASTTGLPGAVVRNVKQLPGL